jgi:arsenate reductase
MHQKILDNIEMLSDANIIQSRKNELQPLIDFLLFKRINNEPIRLNFICTHNSRRSHLAQVWAQTMTCYYGINNLQCYSGDTEVTTVFYQVVNTLTQQGFQIQKLSESINAVYAIKFSSNESPIICFSKLYNDEFNPKNAFAAILLCSNAEEECPVVIGAEARFSIQYEDPKTYDNTEIQNEKYAETSLEIAQEMKWIFENAIER